MNMLSRTKSTKKMNVCATTVTVVSGSLSDTSHAHSVSVYLTGKRSLAHREKHGCSHAVAILHGLVIEVTKQRPCCVVGASVVSVEGSGVGGRAYRCGQPSYQLQR
jgi:hypothetical protein